MAFLWFSFSIYEKLIQYCSIDELGTNYPKDMFDPHGWSEDSYYEALGKPVLLLLHSPVWSQLNIHAHSCHVLLAKAQKVEMDKLEKAKKERTKVRLTTKERGLFHCQFSSPVCVKGKSPPAALNFYFTFFIRHMQKSTFWKNYSEFNNVPVPGL